MKKIFNNVIHTIRRHTPDWLRWRIGPVAAYLAYFMRMRVLGNKDAPKILSINDTLDLIIRKNLSVVRFGDGEMSIMDNVGLGFQKADAGLATRLREIIQAQHRGLLICLPDTFGGIDDFAEVGRHFALHHQFRYRQAWLDLLTPGHTYGNTFITRPYLGYKPNVRQKSGEVFRKLCSIWRGKDLLLIEGAKSRVGVGNDMLKGAGSVSRILGPAENAYAKYHEILQTALKVGKDKLILLALGPAAKVLAYEFFLKGYRVIDIGHADMEYEMYLRNELIETKVKYKYFNEINERDPEECTHPEYLSQIIANIQ